VELLHELACERLLGTVRIIFKQNLIIDIDTLTLDIPLKSFHSFYLL